MQAMANFQQAAAAAMQAAVQGMQGIAGMGLLPVAAASNPQAYQETMAAFAMQQAAAAAAGQQFAVLGMPPGTPFLAHPMAWPTAVTQQPAQNPNGVPQAQAPAMLSNSDQQQQAQVA
jgi:hypothetical protein